MRGKVSLSIAILWVGLPLSVLAGEYNYQNVIPGERASGMGGAFVAVADDSSAVVYNPAGLIQVEHSSFHLSATLFQARGKVYHQAVADEDLTLGTTGIFPLSSGGVRSFLGGKIGFFLMAEDLSFEADRLYESVSVAEETYDIRINAEQKDRTYTGSAAYARKLTKRISAGVAFHYLWRTHSAYWFILQTDPDAGASGEGNITGITTYEEGEGSGLLAQVGILFRVLPWMQWGASMKSGGGLLDVSQIRRMSFSRNEESEKVDLEESLVETEMFIPASASFGVAFFPGGVLTLTCDLSAYEGGRGKKPTWNVNVGTERIVKGRFPVRLGFYTNHSAAPDPEIEKGAGQPEKVGDLGFTLGGGYVSGHASTSLSLLITAGSGQTVMPDVTGANEKVLIDQGSIGFIYSGTYWF